MPYMPAPTRYDAMTYNRVGKSGLKLPAISFGLWQNFGEKTPHETKRAMVQRAFDLGITHFDLANNYGPPPGAADPYDRAWWHLDDGARLALRDVRRFGRVAVIGSDASALPTLAAIGPEPFDPAFTPEVLWANLRRRSVRVKTNLLSQRPVAGVGNIYADEALWRAGIHPAARAISRPAAARLHAALLEVLTAGIEHGGTTLRDYRGVDGSTGSNQLHLACYGRAGQPCPRCGATLRRSVVDGRGTTHCPLCQRR